MSSITTRQLHTTTLDFAIDEAGEGQDVALCLHGFPESRYSWRHQLPVLAEQGWHAVAPDMRGYGGTTRSLDRAAYRMERLVEDVASLFDALGARRRLLIAHDWGALIAWQFAIQRVRPLDGLVIMNVPHPAVFRAVRAFAGMAVDKSAFPPEVLANYQQNAQQPGALTAMINYYRANFLSLADNAPAPMIETPTLMIWGEQDTALGIELTEGYEPYVSDFTLRRFPGVSHWVQQEAPGPVNAALLDWLATKRIVA